MVNDRYELDTTLDTLMHHSEDSYVGLWISPYVQNMRSRPRGGTNNGHCRPDDPRTIDWIFGSQGVEFTGYVEDHGPLVRRATDHPVVTASVHLVGAAPPPAAGD